MIRELTNGERLVAEGLRIELRDGETRMTTSAEIAQWANVSESTVSRAMSGLIAKHVITARRVVYVETGRDRWEITLIPLRGSSGMPAPTSPPPPHRDEENEGSVMDDPILMPQEADGASEYGISPNNDTSMTDPSNILDSCIHMQQQHGAHEEHFCSDNEPPPESPTKPPDTPLPHVSLSSAVYTVQCEIPLERQEPSLPGGLSQIAFSGALAKIRRHAPGYTEVRFAADLDKALTRFDTDEADRAVALVIWCAMRGETVYGRDDLRTRARMGRPLGGMRSSTGASGSLTQPAQPARQRQNRPTRQARQEDAPPGSWDNQLPGVVLPDYLLQQHEAFLRSMEPGHASGGQLCQD